jgi:hypothetical protein
MINGSSFPGLFTRVDIHAFDNAVAQRPTALGNPPAHGHHVAIAGGADDTDRPARKYAILDAIGGNNGHGRDDANLSKMTQSGGVPGFCERSLSGKAAMRATVANWLVVTQSLP